MVGENKQTRSSFPGLYWLVVLFEFFERGSYYGMMSVLSVYLTDILHFAKEDVGVIKGTIQPLLYFLPILSGALADRFGYRRTLMVAFSLLGSGYFLTSQASEYAMVFMALVVMGIGAGTFKPIISGTIARCTDESNSTLGFGIFYWSINLGAFLFPLLLVPFLKNNIGWQWVIVASAIGTGAMLIPTIFFFKEPPKAKEQAEPEPEAEQKPGMLQTLANAFEIIYSPLYLIRQYANNTWKGIVLVSGLLLLVLYGISTYIQPQGLVHAWSAHSLQHNGNMLQLKLKRDVLRPEQYSLKMEAKKHAEQTKAPTISLTIYNLNKWDDYQKELHGQIMALDGFSDFDSQLLEQAKEQTLARKTLAIDFSTSLESTFTITKQSETQFSLLIQPDTIDPTTIEQIAEQTKQYPALSLFSVQELQELVNRAARKPFMLLFLGLWLLVSFIMMRVANVFQSVNKPKKILMMVITEGFMLGLVWGLPGLTFIIRFVCSLISLTVLAILAIETDKQERFVDHFKFLLMIFIYSGFWVLYFQMFDSVLWYVKAYVDASALNNVVNSIFASIGVSSSWYFDVEHVTVINAGTIILLQLIISNIVKNTKALPTMIIGIAMGTFGMGILAISTGIWVFILGIVIFSIGEMTAHPKFISYIGQTAPKNKVAMYMGYLFLYGVIGSSIGGVVGANLYVTFVDQLNQPRTLWLIFATIGVVTIIGLLLYNKFISPSSEKSKKIQEIA